jgi:hypothetical protein
MSYTSECEAQDSHLADVLIEEKSGLNRDLEYVEFSLQIPFTDLETSELNLVVRDKGTDEKIPCQIFNKRLFKEENIAVLRVLFPVSIVANEKKQYALLKTTDPGSPVTDLSYQGKELNIIVDSEFYQADLSKSDESRGKNHDAGHLRELVLKMGFNVRLSRAGNRMHWGPNFQKKEYVNYVTISAWDNPQLYELDAGPYLIHTLRSDKAPRHPEIVLTANYYFYSGLPFFKFHSSMEFTNDVWLSLLRNDEMTMDSLFTHVAFQRPNGYIEDLSFSERYRLLEQDHIENDAPWLCFYHADKGYAFGSIRLKYDTKNALGCESPTYLPYTKISDGEGGGKYWNRLLIHEFPLFVPTGSRYIEENAYIVFKTRDKEKFADIQNWSRVLHHPLHVSVIRD